MDAKTWYIDPNGDGTADVYRGDSTTATRTNVAIETTPLGEPDWQATFEAVTDAEVTPELPEKASAGNAGNSSGLSQRAGEILREMALDNYVVGPPPSL